MKTLIVLALTMLLTACATAPMTQVEQDAPPAEETVIPAMELTPAEPIEPEEIIRYTARTVLHSGTERAESGENLVSHSFHVPYLTAYREDGTPVSRQDSGTAGEKTHTNAEQHALAVTKAFNEKFEGWTASEELSGLAEETAWALQWCREEGIEWYGGCFLKLNCAIYQTERLISVSGTYYSDTGGAHPNTWLLGWNFDLEEGVFISPELLGDGTRLQEAVAAEIIRQAGVPMEDGTVMLEHYWEDYEAIANNWSSYAVTFDDEGMTVTFSPYEIAPYAAGHQVFHLSYGFLEPYLSVHGRVLLGLDADR